MNLKRDYKSFDFVLLTLVCITVIFGLIILGSISRNLEDVNRTFYKQQVFAILGLIVLLAAAFIDYNFICKFIIPIYLVNLAMLVLVFVLPNAANENTNTARWLELFGISVQPSEFSKIFMLIFLAALVDKYKGDINSPKILLMIFALAIPPFILVLLQPSLSASVVVLVILLIMLFNIGISYKYIIAALAITIPTIALFLYELFSGNRPVLNFLMEKDILKPYHLERVDLLIKKDPNIDEYKQTYNSLNAIGSGGLFGKGLYNGTATKFGYIANNDNDFIVSAIGEELGFVGCVIAISLIFLIIIKCLLIAQKSPTTLGKSIILGIVGLLAFQTFANVCVATDLLPNTGIPFPFISAGGSSLLVYMAMIGLVINIGMEKTKSIFEG
ncbi:MAG: FtsW/RodA/SpoVE family cell cycle protein [Clostridiales bacterium]|jgi:rod shape determining protein RodA|nr:FtsW/RodA/SpoVE family cell cycle protein [Clostridiales bacterium]